MFDCICISNGVLVNLENILVKFIEFGYICLIWMIEFSYFFVCLIFIDVGFEGCFCGVFEDEEGFDVEFLRKVL